MDHEIESEAGVSFLCVFFVFWQTIQWPSNHERRCKAVNHVQPVLLCTTSFFEFQAERQNTHSHISSAGQEERQVVKQDSARRRNTLQT